MERCISLDAQITEYEHLQTSSHTPLIAEYQVHPFSQARFTDRGPKHLELVLSRSSKFNTGTHQLTLLKYLHPF